MKYNLERKAGYLPMRVIPKVFFVFTPDGPTRALDPVPASIRGKLLSIVR